MAQVFHVLRCFTCETFQVHQVKKSIKWVCKVCNAKQSVTKVFGRGTAADCRRHVQKLNMMRAESEQQTGLIARRIMPADAYSSYQSDESPPPARSSVSPTEESPHNSRRVIVSGTESRWMAFMELTEQNEEEEEDAEAGGASISTSESEFEQVKKKRCMNARSQQKHREVRLTGFHPIAKTSQPSTFLGRDACSISDGLLPYSAVGERMQSLVNQQCTISEHLFASKSSIALGGTIGQYHQRSKSGEEETLAASMSDSNLSRFEEPMKSRSYSSHSVCKPIATAAYVHSKWNQFLTPVVDDD